MDGALWHAILLNVSAEKGTNNRNPKEAEL